MFILKRRKGLLHLLNEKHVAEFSGSLSSRNSFNSQTIHLGRIFENAFETGGLKKYLFSAEHLHSFNISVANEK